MHDQLGKMNVAFQRYELSRHRGHSAQLSNLLHTSIHNQIALGFLLLSSFQDEKNCYDNGCKPESELEFYSVLHFRNSMYYVLAQCSQRVQT